MRLFELYTDPLIAKIVAVTDQLKSDIRKDNVGYDWDVDTLLKYFQKYDVILDRTDLYTMIQQPPLKGLIKNIQGDKVIFKGQEEASSNEVPPDETQKIIKQMAQKALKR